MPVAQRTSGQSGDQELAYGAGTLVAFLMKKQIPTDQHITFQLQFRKCGKSSCSTCRRTLGHGPYWYAYWRISAKLISGYVGKIRPPQYQQYPQRHHKHSRLQSTQPAPSSIREQQIAAEARAREAMGSAVSTEPVEPIESVVPILETAAVCI